MKFSMYKWDFLVNRLEWNWKCQNISLTRFHFYTFHYIMYDKNICITNQFSITVYLEGVIFNFFFFTFNFKLLNSLWVVIISPRDRLVVWTCEFRLCAPTTQWPKYASIVNNVWIFRLNTISWSIEQKLMNLKMIDTKIYE